jgi:hypothetical protein
MVSISSTLSLELAFSLSPHPLADVIRRFGNADPGKISTLRPSATRGIRGWGIFSLKSPSPSQSRTYKFPHVQISTCTVVGVISNEH